MAADHRPREEVRPRKAAPSLRLVQIRERAVRLRLVDPAGDAVQDLGARAAGRDGRGLELPVALREQVAAVEREAVLLHHVGVPGGLLRVDAVRDEVVGYAVALRGGWGEGTLRGCERGLVEGVQVGLGEGGGGVSDARVEAEDCVGVEAVQCRPAAVPVVGQLGMRAVARHGEGFPLLDVGVRYVLWGQSVSRGASQWRTLRCLG